MPAPSEVSVSYILLAAAFVVPGAISLYVYGLIRPSPERTLRDLFVEALAISIVNFVVLFWPIYYAIRPETLASRPAATWAVLLICLFVLPAVWPILLNRALTALDRLGWTVTRSRTAWDEVFLRHAGEGCWVIAEVGPGERIGGRFSRNSFASAFPREGHIYIQELWEIDSDDTFVRELPGPQGVVLRPGDYHYIRVIKADHDYA